MSMLEIRPPLPPLWAAAGPLALAGPSVVSEIRMVSEIRRPSPPCRGIANPSGGMATAMLLLLLYARR